mgnify:FL=1
MKLPKLKNMSVKKFNSFMAGQLIGGHYIRIKDGCLIVVGAKSSSEMKLESFSQKHLHLHLFL